MHRLYGRRSERYTASPDQLPLDFGEGQPVEILPDVTDDEVFVAEHEAKKKRRKKKKRGGPFPDHYERRVERIEPVLPEGVRLEDCKLIGVDVVEILDFDRPRLWVRRLEYPKYKIPSLPELNIVQGPRCQEPIGFGRLPILLLARSQIDTTARDLRVWDERDQSMKRMDSNALMRA